METFLSFLIASIVTLLFVRRYLKTLSPTKKHGALPPGRHAVETRTSPCPRCSKPVPAGSAFCGSCGAALAMWNVHRAQVKDPGDGADELKGRPRPIINASLCIGCGSCVDACPESGTLVMLAGKAILANPESCTGHAKCVDVCPTNGITLAFGNVLQTIRVPNVNENFETNVPGVFVVGELGGMALIKTAINEGKLVIDRLRERMEAAGEWNPRRDDHGMIAPASEPPGGVHDVIIVGAGPAGLSASLAAHQLGLSYLTLEQDEIAATIRNYPRHKFLMAEPIEMPLYGNLYIGDGTKEALLSVWETIIANTGVKVRTRERVMAIRRHDRGYRIETPLGEYSARYVILALGKRGTPRRLSVAGEELSKVAYRLIEADSYAESNIVVVGGGDSAVEAAMALGRNGTNRTTLAYRGDEFTRVRERNLTRFQEAEHLGRVTVMRKSRIHEIRPKSVILECAGTLTEIPNDYVFVLTGGESPEDFLRKTGIEIVEKAISA